MKHYSIDFVFVPKRFKSAFNRSCLCSFNYDIAVIKTIEVIPVHSLEALPTLIRHQLKSFHKFYTYGWGQTEAQVYPDKLHSAQIYVINVHQFYPSYGTRLMFSSGGNISGQVGDSGGPWMSLDNTRIYGIYVGQTPPIGVAVKMSYFADWIFYVMYEYRDLLPSTSLPRNRVIRCCDKINKMPYQLSW